MDPFLAIRNDPRLDALCEMLRPRTGLAIADGLWGSAAPILAAAVHERLARPLLLVTAHSDEADDARDDVETLTGSAPDLLPAPEALPGEPGADDDIAAERLRICMQRLALEPSCDREGAVANEGLQGSTAPSRVPLGFERSPLESEAPRSILIAPVQALMHPVPSPRAIADASITVSVGERREPAELAGWLVEHGFTRCDQVEAPGDFAQRGGIVDVFGQALTNPVRIEFLGSEVESIRAFDAGTQRSAQALGSVRIPAPSAAAATTAAREASTATAGFLSYLSPDTIVAVCEPTEVQELGRTYWQRLGERAGIVPVDAILRRANEFAQLHLQRFGGGVGPSVSFGAGSLPHFEPKSADALRGLSELCGECDRVHVLCDNEPERQRFRELLAETAAAGASFANVEASIGVVHRGFVWRARTRPLAVGDERADASSSVAFVPHHELFSRYRQRRTLRRVQPARAIDSFFDLNTGDHVVHAQHGIGRFRGLKVLERSGRRDEYLEIEYAERASVHVPVSQIHAVQKYIGSFRGRPVLSKVGGQAWKRTQERVAESVRDLALEMLAVQAQRSTQPGIAYPPDTNWQREFEGSFLYTETDDQLRASEEIKADMARARPMDRLLCGDVGYGKTELALRAAFKAVEFGKQVAVLVPTTVLAEQHYATFRERLADYPFSIDVLSRFRARAEQARIVERARKGQVDIVIGTHRLLSADVHFADLGLVIIDEEQRFGVDAKEQLKRLRATVDVLTLSATPIPRTLHMAMLGIRDISSLATPPVDRRAIVTQVRTWEDGMIREAVLRELNREGQVYFVHNFVRDLHAVANQLRSLVPEARVVVGHGQMAAHELEEVMLRFVRREADVLVATNIIESGLDIPTANTIFIHRAERFGLADLHQLRGRVGRSRHRAYCYLLLSPKHPVKDTAARRLKAIEHYSELGAGFQIAMRDLEIRGAGNILGPEQSGNIEAVGYEMYCQLLEQAVKRLRDEPAEPWRPVNLELGVSASIPRAYIRSERQRMEVYRRLAGCRGADDVRVLAGDLRDAFGPPPDEVLALVELAEIRALAQPWGIRSIVLTPPDVVFTIDDLKRVEPLFAGGPGSPRVPDPHTVHWRLPAKHLEHPTLRAVLRAQLSGQRRPASARALQGAR